MQFIVKMSGIGYTMIKEIFQGGGRIMDISERQQIVEHYAELVKEQYPQTNQYNFLLLYTSDAADE